MPLSNKEILEKSIRKAIQSGFNAEIKDGWVTCRGLCARLDCTAPYDIIFNHDFAKALWGELPKRSADMYDCPKDEIGQVGTYNWEHHLQQMVIADNPVEYLGECLEDDELDERRKEPTVPFDDVVRDMGLDPKEIKGGQL